MSNQHPLTSGSESIILEPIFPSSAMGDSLQLKVRAVYNTDLQAEFFDIRSEVDSLLQQLQTLKYQRLTTTSIHT